MRTEFQHINPDDVKVERINDSVKTMEDFDNHEHVFKITNDNAGVTIFVGVHDTTLGPGLGGFRFTHYENEEGAIKDVLRLSRGMTYKNAAADLDLGGGKATGMAPQGQRSCDGVFEETIAVGINEINANNDTKFGGKGVYYSAEDVGVSVSSAKNIKKFSDWVVGAVGEAPDPSPQTARTVVQGMKEAMRERTGDPDIARLRVGIQGLGAVGMEVARLLFENEQVAELYVSEPNEEAAKKAAELYDAKIVGLDEIYDCPVDIFCPSALGATLTKENIDRLIAAGVHTVCGAANNQIPDENDNTEAKYMHEKGITYVPDFVANSGGVAWVGQEEKSACPMQSPELKRSIIMIASRTAREVFAKAKELDIDTATAARMVAQDRIDGVAKAKAA